MRAEISSVVTSHKEVDGDDHPEGGHDSDALAEAQLKLRFGGGFVRGDIGVHLLRVVRARRHLHARRRQGADAGGSRVHGLTHARPRV